MKVGEKIKMVIEESGETRYYIVERIYGSNVIFRVIGQEEAGEDAKKVTIKHLHKANRST